jgi:hypothetical protein
VFYATKILGEIKKLKIGKIKKRLENDQFLVGFG